MRGPDEQTSHMFSYLSPEQRVRQDHPLRAIRRLTDEALASLSPRFTKMYSEMGRPSIPPEQLLRALLLQSLYTVRSERLLMEEIDYSVLFRWFVGLGMDDPIWSPTTFSKNRDRLLESDIAAAFFDAVVGQAKTAGLLSDEHFTVDGTQLEAWASLKSFKRRGAPPDDPPDDPGNPTVNFRGEKRSNKTHASTTDPDAQLYKKADGQKSVLAYLGHLNALKPELTAQENLQYLAGLRMRLTVRDCRAALERVGLGRYAQAFARTLSAGQKRRLALARLTLDAALLWVLDEPATHLDVEGFGLVEELLRGHLAQGGIVVAAAHQRLLPNEPGMRTLDLTA